MYDKKKIDHYDREGEDIVGQHFSTKGKVGDQVEKIRWKVPSKKCHHLGGGGQFIFRL